jgi:hypothetical protein
MCGVRIMNIMVQIVQCYWCINHFENHRKQIRYSIICVVLRLLSRCLWIWWHQYVEHYIFSWILRVRGPNAIRLTTGVHHGHLWVWRVLWNTVSLSATCRPRNLDRPLRIHTAMVRNWVIVFSTWATQELLLLEFSFLLLLIYYSNTNDLQPCQHRTLDRILQTQLIPDNVPNANKRKLRYWVSFYFKRNLITVESV